MCKCTYHLSFFCHLTSPEMLVNGLAWTCNDDYISLAGRETQIIASVWTLPDGHGMTAFTLHVFSWTLDDGKPKKHHHLTGDTRAIKDLFHHLDTAAAWLTSQLSPFVFTWRLMVENTPTIITWTWYPSDQRSYMWKQYHLQLRIAQWITELWSFHGLLKGLSAL